MATQHAGLNHKIDALKIFFSMYIQEYAYYATDVNLFFGGYKGHLCNSEELEKAVRTRLNHPSNVQQAVNYPCEFIDFVIEKEFSKEGNDGNLVPLVKNPLSKIQRQNNTTESVRNPLPYRYILDLRQILCPLPDKTELAVIEQNLKHGESLLPAYHYRHFKHWTWAQQNTGREWFEVEPKLIDKTDPDCVWRTKEVRRKIKGEMVKKSSFTKSGRLYQRW